MKTYKSKWGLEITIPILLVLGGTSFLMVYEGVWAGFAINLLVLVFIAYLFSSMYYQVENNLLKISCGFLYNQTIPIEAIKQIKETRNPISSPALSLDRLLITYNKFDTVIISPKDKQEFIADILRINPAINVVLKNRKV